MRNIAIIPARGGSKRLPGKNIMLLKDLPLLAHSINYSKVHDFIDEVYVSTDNEQIMKVALEYGAKVINRPEGISGDEATTVSALRHVLENLDFDVENVILLQATNPLRPLGLLKKAYNTYCQGDYDSLMTVSRNFEKLGKIEANEFIPYNYEMGQRSQDLAPLYFENGLLYIAKATLILKNKILGDTNYPLIVDHPYAKVDIDTLDDFKYAEFIIENYSNE